MNFCEMHDTQLRERMTALEKEYDEIRRELVKRNRPKFVDAAAILRDLDAREKARGPIKPISFERSDTTLDDIGFEVVR